MVHKLSSVEHDLPLNISNPVRSFNKSVNRYLKYINACQ